MKVQIKIKPYFSDIFISKFSEKQVDLKSHNAPL
jgi:hypothetical protein